MKYNALFTNIAISLTILVQVRNSSLFEFKIRYFRYHTLKPSSMVEEFAKADEAPRGL